MKNQSKIERELIQELDSLRQKITNFEKIERNNKRAKKALLESEERYRELIENANSIIIKMDNKGIITFFNDYAQKFFGYTLEEILGKNVRIIIPPKESTGRSLKKMVENILRNPDNLVENINENILKNGGRVWISWRNKAIRDSHGIVIGNLAIGQDITELKCSGDALRNSEQRFRALFENTLDGIMVTVANGSILSANARMCEMLGMSEEEIIHAGRDKIVVQDEKLAAALKERALTGRYQGELTMICKNGSYMPVELSSNTFEDSDGIVKTGQVVRDITERKKSERLLMQAHQELESRVEQRTVEIKRQAELLNLAHDAIIVRDDIGKISFWNTGAEELYGWTCGEALGNVTTCLLHTSFPVPLQEIMDKMYQNSRWEGELIHICKNGRQVAVLSRWALRQGVKGGPPEILEVNRDITVRKESEQAIKRAGEYNRNLIETSIDPLVTIGSNGKVTDVNLATEEVTGYSREELIGTDFSNYFTHPHKARAGYKLAFKKKSVRDYELEIKHRNGHITPVFYNASVYKDAREKVVGVFAAARDVTELKRTEKELLSKTLALEELNTALNVLIDHYKNDQKELEERIVSNIRLRIIPYFERFKKTRLDIGQSALVDIIERSINDISSPFLKLISTEYFRLTPKEVEIASLIKEGKTTKEIALILCLGKRTVDSYRDNIRHKLGMINKKTNLRTYLLAIHNT